MLRRPRVRRTIDQRLNDLVDRSHGPNACHLWKGKPAAMTNGYPRLGVTVRKGVVKNFRVGRLIVARTFGLDPDDHTWVAMHSCDVKACCNPLHLWPGTQRKNLQEAIARGRYRIGEGHASARLSASQVQLIRTMRRNGTASTAYLASLFGISRGHVIKIVAGERWADSAVIPHAPIFMPPPSAGAGVESRQSPSPGPATEKQS
jgi:hypothetical protein